MLLMQFSSAAIFSHQTAFSIEDHEGKRVFRYYPYAVSLVGESFWENLCNGFCRTQATDVCICLDKDNSGMLPLAQRSIILTGDKEVGQGAIDYLKKSVDSGAQPLGVANIIEKIYNPLVITGAIPYISSNGLITTQNNGEIVGGKLEFGERSTGLSEFDIKFLVYPDSQTKKPYIKNAIIDFNQGKILLKQNGKYVEMSAPVQCSYNWIIPISVTSDDLNIENKDEAIVEIPYKKSILDSCSKTMFANIKWKENFGEKFLSLFGGYFSKSENSICINSKSSFYAYYSKCSQGVKDGKISPNEESTFVLFFNRGEYDKLNNAICASNKFDFISNTKITQTCFNLERDGASLELGSSDNQTLTASITTYKKGPKDYYNLANYFNPYVFSQPDKKEIEENNPRIEIIDPTSQNAIDLIRTA